MYTPENSEKWLGVSVDLQERLDGGAQTSIWSQLLTLQKTMPVKKRAGQGCKEDFSSEHSKFWAILFRFLNDIQYFRYKKAGLLGPAW